MLSQLQQSSGALALLGAATIYALFSVLTRELSLMYGDQFQIVARYSVAFLIAFGIQIWFSKSFSVPRDKIPNAIALAVSASVVVLLMTLSVLNTKIANSVFLLYAGSITSSFVIGSLWLKEVVTINKVVAFILVAFGLSMFAESITSLNFGILAGLGAGITVGINNGIRKSLKGVDRNTLLLCQYGLGSLLMVGITLVIGGDIIREVSTLGILVTIFYGFLLIGLGNLLLYGFQHFDVNVGSIILATEILIAAAFGFLFFSELPNTKEMIGGIFIFCAAVVSVLNVEWLQKIRMQ